jgi:hypothetical protein
MKIGSAYFSQIAFSRRDLSSLIRWKSKIKWKQGYDIRANGRNYNESCRADRGDKLFGIEILDCD